MYRVCQLSREWVFLSVVLVLALISKIRQCFQELEACRNHVNNSTLVRAGGVRVKLTQPKELWRSSPTEDYVKVDVSRLKNNALTVDASPMSVLTIFSHSSAMRNFIR